jgi:hypothetical protein
VLITAVDDLPAAFGFVAATACGMESDATRKRIRTSGRWMLFTVNP